MIGRAPILAGIVGCLASAALAEVPQQQPVFNITQVVDHAAHNTSATFQQAAQLYIEHFKPGGPILFVISAESDLNPIQNSVFMDYAEELNALVCTLEHRYVDPQGPDW